MYTKDMILNSKWYDPSKKHHTHPCFFGTVDEVVKDCCGHCPPVTKKEDQEIIDSMCWRSFFFWKISTDLTFFSRIFFFRLINFCFSHVRSWKFELGQSQSWLTNRQNWFVPSDHRRRLDRRRLRLSGNQRTLPRRRQRRCRESEKNLDSRPELPRTRSQRRRSRSNWSHSFTFGRHLWIRQGCKITFGEKSTCRRTHHVWTYSDASCCPIW